MTQALMLEEWGDFMTASCSSFVHDRSVEESPDAVLMRKIANGDEEAFRTLVERHQVAVVGTAAKMLGSHADGEDIGQKVFLRVWKSAARYRPQARFTTWLMTITRRLVFNEIRRRRRYSHGPLEHDGEPLPIPDPSQRPADQEAQMAELRAAVDSAIASLPEKARMAVILRRYEDMPYEQIAGVIGVSIPALKSLLFRARNDLRSRLSGHLESLPPGT